MPKAVQILLALLLGVTPALAAGAPRLKPHEAYSKARATLIRQGWVPAAFDKTNLLAFQRDLEGWYLGQGFNEIRDCSPVGDTLCMGEFRSADGRTLTILAGSGSKADLPASAEPEVLKICLDTQKRTCHI